MNFSFKRPLSLLLAVVLLVTCFISVGVLPVFAMEAGTTLSESDEWEVLKTRLANYEAVWTDAILTGAVSNRMVHTALMGNGHVGANSDGTETEKTYRISKQDFSVLHGMFVKIGYSAVRPLRYLGYHR